MKILVLNPPFLPRFSRESRSPAVTKSGTLYYPMWLAYAAGYLEKQGHKVMLLDAPAAGIGHDTVIAAAREFGPRMAVLDTSTPSIDNDVDMACRLKKALGDLFTVVVGVHVSALPGETMASAPPGLDAAAFGEYDATLAELAGALDNGADSAHLEPVKGLAFRDRAGHVHVNEPRAYIQDLDDIPFVSRVYKKHLDIHPYFYGHSRHPLVVIVTARGCPFHCTYCVVPQTLMGHRYRKRSIGSVVEEFRYIAEKFPEVKEIMIEDDTLTADRGRCREFARALIDAKATRVPWSANARADVDFQTMRLMKKANCRLFCVGFESGDQRILDNIKKATRVDVIRQFMKDARRAGILVHGCFMVGNRGETRETLETTLRFAKELNPDTAQFYPIMVYPGTSDYAYFRDKGWIVTEDFRKWITEDGLHSSVVSNPDLSYEYLVDFCDRARREFYLRPRYILGKGIQIFTRPGEAKRILKASRTFFSHLFRPSLKNTSTSTC
ncbi:MAG: radical SAM protein [Chitinivibrionales bacterium]|nr:radical SAM protein [Chitinivibrionales bacterium]MBD3394155.1 radical SAM protein [Chitinivibrionales bacterium]